MARSRRKERKLNNTSDTSQSGNQNASTSRNRKRASKVTKKRCKSIPESSNTRKRARGPYKLRGTSSVVLVSEIPCCASEEDRRKYAKLGLDSALFLSDSRPAKRTQSHISVITISSSDEDIGMERTAEWVATSDHDGHLCEEESFLVGDSGDLLEEDKSLEVIEPTSSEEQTSVPETPSPNPVFRPLCVSTPEFIPYSSSSAEEELTELSKRLETTFPHASCLASPINFLNNVTPSKHIKGPHTVLSSETASNQNENSQMKSSQKFYFGPFQTSKEIQVSPLSESLHPSTTSAFSFRPPINDMTLSGIQPFSGQLPALYVMDASQGTELPPQRHLRQIPSTSRSPVSSPIYITEISDVTFEDEESRPQ